jgi:signal transduction histidine kinase
VTLKGRSNYLRLWRGLGRELACVLTALPIAIVTTVALWTGVGLGIGLTIVWLGIPVLVATLLVARWLGGIELQRLQLAGRPPIVRPTWSTKTSRPGLSGRVIRIVADSRYWVQALHGAVISLVLSVATWSVVVVWLALSLGGPTLWYWQRWVPVEPAHSAALYAVVGLFAIATLPYVVHATVLVHDFAARRMLGEWRVTALRRDAALSEASRASAILAEDSSLRRLERDIHDGPQQGLLRIQFDLASASRALEPQHPALPLVQSALRVAGDTLTELRELSRGLAPPLLQDRGLESAVRALAARSEVRVTTTFSSVDDPGIADL